VSLLSGPSILVIELEGKIGSKIESWETVGLSQSLGGQSITMVLLSKEALEVSFLEK